MLCSSCISGLGAESSHGVAGWVPSSSMLINDIEKHMRSRQFRLAATMIAISSVGVFFIFVVHVTVSICMYIYIIIICINIHQCQPQHQRLKSTTIHYHHLPSSHRSSLNKHVESTPAARQLFTVLAPVDVHPGGLQLAKTGQRHVVVTPGIQTSGEIGF